MNTRSTRVVRVADLQKGDVIDGHSIGCWYGRHAHCIVEIAPSPRYSIPGYVVFHVRLPHIAPCMAICVSRDGDSLARVILDPEPFDAWRLVNENDTE